MHTLGTLKERKCIYPKLKWENRTKDKEDT